MSIVWSRWIGAAGAASIVAAGALGCGGGHAEVKAPPAATPSAGAAGPGVASAQPVGRAPSGPRSPSGAAPSADSAAAGAASGLETQEDAELVVSREIVARCPSVRLVREHLDEFDPDMVWLAVLESLAECMSDEGPLSAESIRVTGDEEHRHVVREVLNSRGVAPARVVGLGPASPAGAREAAARGGISPGAAECQGGSDCTKRIEITLLAP